MGNRRKIDRAEQARAAASLARRIAIFALRITGLCASMALVCGAVYGSWRWATTSPTFAIRTIAVTGNERATEPEIRRLLGISEGENIFLSDLGSARDRLLEHPWIREVTVERSFPQGVDIAVLERRPVALVDLGNLYLLDEVGEVFKRALPGDPIDLPVITGVPRDEWTARPEERRDKLDEALHVLEAYGVREIAKANPAAEIHLDAGEGVTLYVGDRGPAVMLGHGDFARKLDRFERVLAEVERRGESLELVRLDNRARPGWIAARLSSGTKKTATP